VIAHVKLGEILWKQSCPVPGVNGACVELTRVRAAGAARVAAAAAAKQKGPGKKGKKKKGANLPPQCGPETKSKIVVHTRKPNVVKEAMTHFAEALKLFKGGAAVKSVPGKDENERTERGTLMAYYAAEARINFLPSLCPSPGRVARAPRDRVTAGFGFFAVSSSTTT